MKSIHTMTYKEIADELNISIEKAKEVKGVITRKIPPENYESVRKWVKQCYNEPTNSEKKLEALNEIIEGYGTEGIFSPDFSIYWCLFKYINTGDTYSATIIRLGDQKKYIISSWGDIIEYYEKKGYQFN